jgi:hypothetical protein
MPRFVRDPNRLNYTVSQTGKEYNLRVLQRAQPIFTTLLNLLASNYVSAVQGPQYTNEMKAVAVELAKLELALEDVDWDRTVTTTRPEFLYSIIGYFLFQNGRIPNLQWDDDQFRDVLINLIRIYFQGSIPKSMGDVAALFIDGTILVRENFLLLRQGASGLDISDQFGFDVDVMIPLGGGFPADLFNSDAAIRQILDIVRPAHTLYRLRYIFQDKYIPNDPLNKILDAMRWYMSSYNYDDFRVYCQGIRDRDRLGVKVNQHTVSEDHSADF